MYVLQHDSYQQTRKKAKESIKIKVVRQEEEPEATENTLGWVTNSEVKVTVRKTSSRKPVAGNLLPHWLVDYGKGKFQSDVAGVKEEGGERGVGEGECMEVAGHYSSRTDES